LQYPGKELDLHTRGKPGEVMRAAAIDSDWRIDGDIVFSLGPDRGLD